MANIWDKLEQQAFEPNKKDETPSGTSVWDNLEAKAFGNEPPKRNAFTAGIASGIDELQGLAYSGGAALADVAGLDKAKNWLDEQAKRNTREAAVNARPDLERIEDQSLGTALPYLAYQVGKQVPNLVGGIAFGAAVPEAAVPAFLSRGAAMLPKWAGGGALGAAEGYAAKKAALQAGTTFGEQVLGGAAFNEAQAIGSLYQAAQEGGDQNAGLKAIAGSIPYAITETLPEAMLVGRFAHGGFSGNILSRAAKGFGTQAVTGATSEALQNEMEMALNPNLTAEQKASNRLNSIAAGGLVEGILGGAGGTLSKSNDRQAGSLLKDTTQTQEIANKPDLNAIDKAINDNSPEVNMNAPTVEQMNRELNPLAQPSPTPGQVDQAQQQVVEAQQQQAQEQEAQAHAAAQQEFNYKSSVYGIQALPEANQFQIGGKRLFSTTQAQQFIHGMDELNQGLGDELKFMIGAAVNSGALKITQTATPKSVNNAAIKFLADWGLADATGVDQAASRVETIISSLEGPRALKDADVLNNFYKSITGTNAPAFEALQQAAQPLTKGATNERLQLQGNAGLREVPVQGRTTETGGAGTGNVRPAQIQPVGTGSVGAGSPSVQAGTIPSSGVSTSTSPSTPVSDRGNERTGQGQGQVTERESALAVVNQVITRAFGERDAKIVLKVLAREKTQAEIAKEFGISDARVNQIAGPQAQETWGPRLLLAARNMGISKQEMANFLEIMSVEEAAGEAQVMNEDILAGKEGAEEATPQTSDENLTLGTEELSKEEGPSGYRVFNPEVSGATELEDAAAKNRTRQKLKKVALEKLEDYELNNLAADEKTTVEELDAIVAELLKRQEVRVAKGNENAVQKQSTSKGNVRKSTGNRQEVGEANAKPQEPTRAREAQTDEEAASQAWNEGVKDFPEAPKFADLTKEQQDDWISFGPDNWTADDVQTELVKLAKLEAAGVVINKNATKRRGKNIATDEQNAFIANLDFNAALPDVDEAGNPVSLKVATTTLEALKEKFPGVAKALDIVSENHPHLLDAITNVGVVDSYDFSAAIVTETKPDGKSFNWLMVTKGTLETTVPGAQAFTVIHETGHLADMSGNGGAYSNHPALSVRKKGKDFIMHGAAIKELFAFYEKNKNAQNDLASLLSYPFETMASMDAKEFQQEVFAQLWASYYNTALSAQLESGAPNAYKFIEEAYNHAEEKRSVVPSSAAAARTKAAIIEATFKNRYKGSNVQSTGGLPSQPTQQIVIKKSKTLAQAREASASQVAKLPKPIRGPLQHIFDNVVDFAKKGVPWAAFTEDLADIAAKYIPSAKKYVNLMKERQAIRTKYERNIDLVLQQYDKLPSEVKGTGEKSINKFLKDMTMDGQWAYNPGWIKNFDETKQISPALKERFEAFPPAAQALIKEVFSQGYQSLKSMQKAVTENINTEFDALIAAAKKAGDVQEEQDLIKKKQASLTEYATLMRTNSKSPYAPLKRFGNYVVVGRSQAYLDAEKVRDDASSTPDQVAEANKKLREFEKNEDHYFVQFAETMGEAKAIAREEGSNYALVEPFEKDTARQALFGGKDVQGLFYRLRHMVEESSDTAVSDASERAINRLLSDLHLSLLSDQSARQSERRRRKIAGAENDMMRAFATQGRANAHFIASLENSESIYENLRAMKDEADARTPGREDRRRYYNEFMKRHAMGLEYQPSPFIDKALSTTSAWMLLTNPAYYLQNMTQPFMMSLPVVGGKHGYTRSWKEFIRAYNDIASVVKNHGIGEDSYGKLPNDVRMMVEELVNRGRIDISLEQDLGRWRSTEDSKFAKFGQASEKLRAIAQNIETLNRVATAVAAYRLEVKRSNPTSALNYADKIIYTTHGDYSGFNAPRITRTTLGRLATQFRKFQLIQLSLMTRLFHDAFAGADKQTRQIGRRALMYTIGHTAVMGGAMGLPGFALLGGILASLMGDDDEPDDPELAMRRAIGNDALADLLVKGVPAALGVDVSGKLGMGQMLSVLPYTDITLSRKGVYEVAGTLLTGPFGGLLAKSADGLSYMGQGDYYKGIEQMLPTGLSNVLKGARVATEGVTSRTGDITLNADEISFLDGFMVALGLPTKTMTDRAFLQNVKYEFDQFYNDRASEVKREYVRAYRSGDGEALNEARQDWAKLQESRARNGYTRQPLSTLIKAPMEQAKRERNTIGGVAVNKANRGFVKQTSEL